ncbi:MAG: Holliday junction resolvase RuvX [Bacteroidota bacterium]
MALKQPPRLVGVDYGHKRVGLALADPLRMFAKAFATVHNREVLHTLAELDQREGIEAIVIGWPLLPDGSEGDATKKVASFIQRLAKALPDVAIIRMDERYTSEEAKQVVRATTATRKQRRERGRVDAAAAALILQRYLDDEPSV